MTVFSLDAALRYLFAVFPPKGPERDAVTRYRDELSECAEPLVVDAIIGLAQTARSLPTPGDIRVATFEQAVMLYDTLMVVRGGFSA